MPGLLTHPPSDVLRQLLIDLGLGTNSDASPQGAWPVFASGEPATPDSVITIYDTDGSDQGRYQTDGTRIVYQGFQVRVRSATKPTGYAKAESIAIAFDSVFRQSVTVAAYLTTGAATYLIDGITRRGEVLDLGKYVPTAKLSLHTFNGVICVSLTP